MSVKQVVRIISLFLISWPSNLKGLSSNVTVD